MTHRNGKKVSDPCVAARVLVAENDPHDQDEIRKCLEQIGCSFDVANNGVEAIRLFQLTRYDIILAGCQMTDVNSLDAVKKIREFEKLRSRGVGVPIVALMSAPKEEDRKECFDAGVDGWLGKPVTSAYLRPLLERWLRQRSGSAAATIKGETVVTSAPTVASIEARIRKQVIDQTALNSIRVLATPEKPNILRDVIELYLRSAERLLGKIADTAVGNDLPALAQAVHSLKSSSANLGAAAFAELCRELENLCRRGDTEKVPALCKQIAEEFDIVRTALAEEAGLT